MKAFAEDLITLSFDGRNGLYGANTRSERDGIRVGKIKNKPPVRVVPS